MHTTLKNVELLKHFKISKTAKNVELLKHFKISKTAPVVLLILKSFNNSTLFNVVCISWKLKCWMLLMHGVTMKFIETHVFLFRPPRFLEIPDVADDDNLR